MTPPFSRPIEMKANLPPNTSTNLTPLLISLDSKSHVHLIIGSNPLAAARCSKSAEAGAKPIVIAPTDAEVHYTLSKRFEDGSAQWVQKSYDDEDLKTLGRAEVDGVVDAVFVTLGRRHPLSTHISTVCRRLRIPVNVADAPNLCTFTLLSTHSDGPLHVGITTSGRGCKLSSRIRREVAAALPPNFGNAIERLGTIRRRIWEEDHAADLSLDQAPDLEDEDATAQKHTFNTLVTFEDLDAARNRRMRWLSQICEYWPLRRLASINDADVEAILAAYSSPSSESAALEGAVLDRRRRAGHITLAGSGPGNPELLTRATHRAIQDADLILADKLVPAPVLDLIPRRTEVYIARKFPGNADKAQEELLSMGLEGLKSGKNVLRLKQGDPYLYGRGAEEYDFFQKHGYTPSVLPGITSALSAPLFAGIPPTHRSVADQVLICTGTGRKGAVPDPPPYVPTQTIVFLMALHRLSSLVESLTNPPADSANDRGAPWPKETPCAVVERASCPDQRVIRATLENVCAAVEEEGSRPPGLLVVGWSCEVIHQPGGHRWTVEEGFKGMDYLAETQALASVEQGTSVASVS